MRLRRLEVSHCAGIAGATVDFEPGLNVLHGPNELGKSTLAAAIRAALLVQSSSRAADPLRDWHADADPEVALTFEQRAERIWRVRKRFLPGGGTAYLDFSRDGRDFSPDNRGRAVEAALQAILRWGIEPPGGGRGGPRGMPSSLIATALLGRQDDVTAILGGSLDGDASPTGRDHLIEALQALAEDPRFKQVLNEVQEKVDEAFTATGRKAAGRGSPWARLRREREEAEGRRRDVAERQRTSEAAREHARTLRDDHEAASHAAGRLRAAFDQRGEQERLERALAGARAELDEVEGLFDRLATAEAAEVEAAREVARLRSLREEQAKRQEELALRLEAAEKRVGDLEGGAEEQGRRLREQELTNELLRLRQRDGELAGRIDALREIVRLTREVEAKQTELTKRTGLVARERAATEADEAEIGRLRLRRAIVRLSAAIEAVGEAAAERDEALAHADRAAELDARTAEMRTEIDAMSAPDDRAMARLREVATELRVAREKLAVGIVMEVTLADGRTAEVEVDGAGATRVGPGESARFEAQRELRLTLPDAAGIRVRGGGRDLLNQAEDAERRWRDASEGIFARTGCASIEALDELRGRAVAKEREAAGLDADAVEARALAGNIDAREVALVEAEQMARDRRREAEELLEEGETLDRLLATSPTAAGADLDARIEALEAAVRDCRARADQMSNQTVMDEREIESLRERAADRARELGALADDAAWGDLLATEERRRAEVERDLRGAERQLGAIREAADQEVEAARETLARRRDEHDKAGVALDKTAADQRAAEQRLARLDGELGPLRRQARGRDADAAKSAVEDAEAALRALPPSADARADMGLDDLERRADEAERRADALKSDLDRAEGALEQLGGQVLEEQAAQVADALAALDQREHELEVDYGAWRMLRDVLKEAEREDAVHLGRALVKPVSEKMGALTQGRYGEVAIGPQLDPGGIDLGGAQRRFDALSVGTQEQIALLLRLAIAEALGSFMVLDDQLTQSDGGRLGWMRDALVEAARRIQIIVLTCRPDDYAVDGRCNVVDLTRCIERGAVGVRASPPEASR